MPPALAICATALSIEAVTGYPTALFRWAGHPVTWIGAMIAGLDRCLNQDDRRPAARRRNGILALAILLVTTGATAAAIQIAVSALLPPLAAIVILGLFASSCLAQRSLDAHVRAVADAFALGGLADARAAVSMIVGRDTAALDVAGVASAAIESLAENFADGIVAPAFWIALAGLPGGLVYKAINTADSMIGHRTPRHLAFGWAAARLDDGVNWPAARLSALWIVLAAALLPSASARGAWRVMRRDAHGHASPNAGWPEAAMAGALGIRLGGARNYAGRRVEDASMGDGAANIDAGTIHRALAVYRVACGLNVAAVIALALIIARWP